MTKTILYSDNANLIVDCDISLWRPANLTGHPDNWTPPEGGDIEITGVSMERGDKVRKLCRQLVNNLRCESWLLDAVRK
jgi:hypothetical protein